jgi:hypothetical protein
MSKRMWKWVAATLVTAPLAVLPGGASATGQGSLEAPVLATTGTYDLDYACVPGAVKYAIDAAAFYCNDGAATVLPWSFTATACGDAQTPDFAVSPADMAAPFCLLESGECLPEELTLVEPTAASFKVKGLNPGQGNGRQNNPFSAWSPEMPDVGTVCAAPI